ncbi:MAG: FeoA family protein [Anaerolineae bacterium]|nr:FeoA family protein [Anaerolineae bacterium]
MPSAVHHHHHRHHYPAGADDTLPLSMVAPGQTVELIYIDEGRRLRKRLADLGLNVGLTVRVVQNSFAGPLILAVREDSRLAIGRGMAHHIRVSPCDAAPPGEG